MKIIETLFREERVEAENRLGRALPLFAKAATPAALREAIERHLAEIENPAASPNRGSAILLRAHKCDGLVDESAPPAPCANGEGPSDCHEFVSLLHEWAQQPKLSRFEQPIDHAGDPVEAPWTGPDGPGDHVAETDSGEPAPETGCTRSPSQSVPST